MWLYFITTNNIYDFYYNEIYIAPELYLNKYDKIYKSNIFSIAIIILRLISNWFEINISKELNLRY